MNDSADRGAEDRTLAVIGGSGFYAMPGLEDPRAIAVTTPFGTPSDAIVEARLAGARVLFLPRHGQDHRLAAHEVNYRANVYALKAAGAKQILSVSAVGSLREEIIPGDVMLVDQYIDRTKSRPGTFFEGVGVVVHAGFAEPVDAALRRATLGAAREAGARTHAKGTYVCIDGPQFSTRAESLIHREWRADVVGMTNLPEARLAREAELPYASLCLVTDFDVWHATAAPVAASAVFEQLRKNAGLAAEIVRRLVERLPDPGASPSSRALDDALLTPAEKIEPEAHARLGVLLHRVLKARSG
ncbi:MAG: S-methyl-5'-thioadenosine phosphorylase [Polyangiaceae bacterium]